MTGLRGKKGQHKQVLSKFCVGTEDLKSVQANRGVFHGVLFSSFSGLSFCTDEFIEGREGHGRNNIDGIYSYQDGPEIDHGNGMKVVFFGRGGLHKNEYNT